MRRFPLTVLAGALLAGCASGPSVPRDLRDRPLAANPSAIVAAELAFNRLAQERGAQAAFRQTARGDAVMFVPRRVRAQDWLRGNAPPAGIRWAPHAVYASCDGSAGATTGAWEGAGGTHGYFTTIWLREANGSFKWALDHGAALTGARREAPEYIAARQATCGTRPPVSIVAAPEGEDLAVGLSADQTLSWQSLVRADGSRSIRVTMWNGTAMEQVIDDAVPASAAAGGRVAGGMAGGMWGRAR